MIQIKPNFYIFSIIHRLISDMKVNRMFDGHAGWMKQTNLGHRLYISGISLLFSILLTIENNQQINLCFFCK